MFDWLKTMQNDIRSALERDPAARSPLEILLAYQNFSQQKAGQKVHGTYVYLSMGKNYMRLAGEYQQFLNGILMVMVF